MKVSPKPALKLLPFAVALCCAQTALAQLSQPSDVVEITAQKRTEKIQDVPLAVSAISGGALESRGIEGAGDLAGAIPNLHMTQTPTSGLIAAVGMRGLAMGQPAIWADPVVGIYVDGVFIGKNTGALTDLVDIERLEALRGPQGTLFGRNTEAGAINFITRKPSGEFTGQVGLELGNYNRQVTRLSMDLPKVGILSASVAARNEKQDGFIDNPASGKDWNNRDRQAARLALRLQPSKDVKIDYAFDVTDVDEAPSAGSLTSNTGYLNAFGYAGSVAGLQAAIASFVTPGYPSAVSTELTNPYQRVTVKGHTLQAEMPVGDKNTFRYIGAVREMKYAENSDYDGTNAKPYLGFGFDVSLFTGERNFGYETQSHEFQLIGSSGSLRWVGGLYYFEDEGSAHQTQIGLLVPNATKYKIVDYDISTKATAVFGQADYDIGKFTVGVGGRYTKEDKTVFSHQYNITSAFVPAGDTVAPTRAEKSWSEFSPTLNVLYRLNDNTNVFARVAKGFKSGGFPAEGGNPAQYFDPETSTSYELGVKGNTLGGKLQYSANVFRMDVDNFQVSLLPPNTISPIIANAGKLQTQGFELDASWSMSKDVRMTVAYGFLDAKFKEYMVNPVSAPTTLVNGADNLVVAGAPKHTLSISPNIRLTTLNDMPLRFIADVRYIAERYAIAGVKDTTSPVANLTNTAKEALMPSQTQVDMKLQLSEIKVGGPGSGDFSIWVKNALNERKQVAYMDLGVYRVGYWSDPRTYGATFNYRW